MMPILLALPGSEAMAKLLAAHLGIRLGLTDIRRFPDGESYVRVKTNLKGRRVVVVSALDRPDDKFLQLVFLASTARDFGAVAVGLVCPYLPYMRQDKRFRSGEAVTSSYFAKALNQVFDWLVTVDPHLHRRHSLSEIYSIPSVAVHAAPQIAKWIRDEVRAPIVIGPDGESAQWVAAVAADARAPYTVLKKQRFGDRSVKVSSLHIGKGERRTPVLVDDIVSTARTMIETVKQIRSKGIPPPCCIAVHGIFAADAYEELRRAGAGTIVSCNTVLHLSNAIDVSGMLAEAVRKFLGCGDRRKRANRAGQVRHGVKTPVE